MKTKNIIMLIVALVLAANISLAQVKQHYKVVDYETGKPLSGVQINFEKQTAVTNAKGIAVLVFADKHYGDFIENNYLILKFPEYVDLGPNWKSRFSAKLLNKDTMVWYMMRADLYYAERDRIFDSLFAHIYRNDYLNYVDTINKEMDKNPEKTLDYLNEIISANLYNWGKYLHDIVSEINKFSMYYINSDIRRECEQALSQGDLKQCLELAKSQIVANDNSDINLQRIFYYLTIRDVMKDTTPASDYYKFLLDNGFKNNTPLLIDYMNCLNEEIQGEEVEKIKQYAKDSCQDPWMKQLVSRYYKSSADENPEETLIEENLGMTQLIQDSFPKFKIALAKTRAATAAEYFNIGDTLHALSQLDTAYENLFQTDKNEYYSEFSYKKRMFFTLQDLMVLPDNNDSLFPIMKKLKDTQVRLASEIYQNRPSLENLILYFYTLKNVLHNYDSISFARISTMDALLPKLKELMPEIMLPQQLSNKSMLFKGCLFLHSHPDSVSFYYNAYKEALAPCEVIYPYMYEWVLDDNSIGKTICYYTGNEYFVKNINSYTHELLEKKSRLLHKDSIQEKANYFHIESEYLYKNNLFAQSITSYDEAINYYRRLCSTNDSAHLEIMTALLQKGDAYLQQKQIKEAFDCYQQVVDYPKLSAKLQTAQTINKAIAYHFQGDVFSMQEDYKTAMKYFDKSEKEFKTAQKSGDTTFYGAWGEMHFNKALVFYYSEQEEKSMEEMLKAEKLYDRYPLNEVSQKYETLKSILIEYHSNTENLKGYISSLYNYLPYCDSTKYIDSDHYHTYINTAALLGDISVKMGWYYDAVRFYQMVKEGKDFLENYGEPKDIKYIRLLYQLGKNYRQMDSLEQAVDYLIQCKELNYKLFSKKNPVNYKSYDLDIKNELASCYEEMEDSTNNNQWFNEALVLRKEIVAELSKIDTNDALRIALGTNHKLLGLLYLKMDYEYRASSHYDTALTILLPFYKNENKKYVEKDIAICYLHKAIIEYDYDEDEETTRDEETIKKLLKECLDVCENAVKPNNLMVIRYNAVSLMLEVLENLESSLFSRNEAEIKKYHKLKADLEKQLSK
ncbi:MAG: hypothetical protein K6F29_06495 [Bacteroidales bacterium]|nr:hypothetical protein [Bacteroidales bacterium]